MNSNGEYMPPVGSSEDFVDSCPLLLLLLTREKPKSQQRRKENEMN
jgi:hypothetical protein